jgi:DNA-binding SARP family transcriptional activator
MADVAVHMAIRLFGSPESRIAGAPLVLHNQKAKALLYYLAATGRSHTRDHLATLLWSESPESNARHSLRSSLYHIRQALHTRGADETLAGDSDIVYLKLDDDACDVTYFRRLLAKGSESALAEAVALYQGPLLQGFSLTDAPLFEDWVRCEEIQLRHAYLVTLQRLVSWAENRQAWEEAIAYLQRIVQLDPLSEEVQRKLIGLYARTGSFGQALQQYQQFEAELKRELGLTPSSETRDAINLVPTLDAINWAPTWASVRTQYAQAQATAHFELGELALVANNYQAAISAARAGLQVGNRLIASQPADVTQRMALVARGHRLLGAALAMEGSDLPAAESHLQEAVAAHRLTDNMSDLCATLFELGNVAAQRGELKHAVELYEEAARTAEVAHTHGRNELGPYIALAHNNIAYHSLLLGQLDAARRALARGFSLAETHKIFGAHLHLYSTQGEINLYLGEWAEATNSFQQGLALAEELGNLERQAGYRAGLALVARGQQNVERAITLFEEALSLIIDKGYWHLRIRLQLWLAEALLQVGRLSEAAPHLDVALATAQRHGRVLLLLQGERLSAQLLAARGDWSGAQALFIRIVEQASGPGLSMEVARTQAVWGETALLWDAINRGRDKSGPYNGRELLMNARNVFAAHDARAELKALTPTMTF